MRTRLVRADEAGIRQAARMLRAGRVVAFPTETVYGLGANALDPDAVSGIYAAKGRPADNPLIVHIAQTAQADSLCRWTDSAQMLAEAFWPGPLTLVLRKKPVVPGIVSAGLDSVGLRLPSHPTALALLRACDLPVAAPSANRSGKPSPTSAQHVQEDMEGRIPLILDGGPCEVGLESTVLDLTGSVPMILRPGAVTPEQVAVVTGACDLAPSLMRPLQAGERAASPGMAHRHYAPRARMSLIEGPGDRVAAYINQRLLQEPGARVMALSDRLARYPLRARADLGPDALSAAHRLFYLLRGFDEQGVDRVYCETLPPTGIGLAVMNRLARAAQFDVIRLG